MLRIATVVGARPQFVKAAAVSRALANRKDVHETVIHTGQHYDYEMSEIFFSELNMRAPDHELGIGGHTHGEQTGRMTEAVERVLLGQAFDFVLVYGDTNSTLAGALAAAKLPLPVAHVEAGLRSFNKRMPEEINRLVTDHLSTLLFAPTTAAVGNLEREGIDSASVKLVGDVMYDVALRVGDQRERSASILKRLDVKSDFVLATIHRAENTDAHERLHTIIAGLQQVARELPVIFPMHPRTTAAVAAAGIDLNSVKGLSVIEPLGYVDMISLEQSASAIVTDSGGVQKEAFFFGTPCVTVRQETEWVELVECGWNRLSPPDDAETVAASVVAAVRSDLPLGRPRLYGDGNAAEQIACALVETAN